MARGNTVSHGGKTERERHGARQRKAHGLRERERDTQDREARGKKDIPKEKQSTIKENRNTTEHTWGAQQQGQARSR